MPRLGTGGDDNLACPDDFSGTFSSDFNLPSCIGLGDEFAMSLQPGDLVLLKQHLDAGGHFADDGVLAGEHLWHVDTRPVDRDTVLSAAMQQMLVMLRGFEQRFRGDATHVKTGSTQSAFTGGCFHCSTQAVFSPNWAQRIAAM